VALGYALLAFDSAQRGLGKLQVAEAALARDLDANWEVLAEPIQTVMRRYGVEKPYEKLKELTRGRAIGQAELVAFIDTLQIPAAAREQLKAMTPASYIGRAEALAKRV
jgi:adenylosuccinate lyase